VAKMIVESKSASSSSLRVKVKAGAPTSSAFPILEVMAADWHEPIVPYSA